MFCLTYPSSEASRKHAGHQELHVGDRKHTRLLRGCGRHPAPSVAPSSMARAIVATVLVRGGPRGGRGFSTTSRDIMRPVAMGPPCPGPSWDDGHHQHPFLHRGLHGAAILPPPCRRGLRGAVPHPCYHQGLRGAMSTTHATARAFMGRCPLPLFMPPPGPSQGRCPPPPTMPHQGPLRHWASRRPPPGPRNGGGGGGGSLPPRPPRPLWYGPGQGLARPHRATPHGSPWAIPEGVTPGRGGGPRRRGPTGPTRASMGTC